MNDISHLLKSIGSKVHYRMFHKATPPGHTQETRHSAPLVETEAPLPSDEPLYDPEARNFEAHPIGRDAIPHIRPARSDQPE
jgi:hypothetical protein